MMPHPYGPQAREAFPAQHENSANAGEYLSDEDELVEHDLHALNPDYDIQRQLSTNVSTYFSRKHEYRLPPRDSWLPSRSTDDLNEIPYQCGMKPHAWNEKLILPPKLSSIRDERMLNSGSASEDDQFPAHFENARAYQSQRKRRPLIDFIKNEWKHIDTSYSSDSSPTSTTFVNPSCLQVFAAPRFQRSVLVIVLLSFLFWGNWKTWAGPKLNEDYALRTSLEDKLNNKEGWFGVNMRPDFLDMTQVKTLNQGLVPQKGDQKRLVIIGDVHGCHEELVSLLTELQYEARTDHLIFTGDMISKGPSSPAVVDLALQAQASCVRGNHEDRMLLASRDLAANHIPLRKVPPPPPPGVPEEAAILSDENKEDDHFSMGDVSARKLAKSFTERQIAYLGDCPIILDVGHVNGLGDVHVVHAGLIAGVPLDKQDPMGVMHMRTVDLETHLPSSEGKGTPWFKLWNRYQNIVPQPRRSTVIYGHDSRRGLQLEKHSKGIDTACVNGGKLSALIIDDDVSVVAPKIVSVDCKDHRGMVPEDKKQVKRMTS